MKLQVRDETSALEVVVLGIADDPGPTPTIEEAYDPKSAEHIKSGTYPKSEDMILEMNAFEKVLTQHGVKVHRPQNIPGVNQIFSRDIAFVIDDYFFKSNILPKREQELKAIDDIIQSIDSEKVIKLPEEVHIEGGDVMPLGNYLFIGTYYGDDYPDLVTARTNTQGVEFLKSFFPSKKIKAFDLVKSNTNAKENALHLDCCFQPVGRGKAIIHKGGFRNVEDYDFLVNLLGTENLFHISKDEMYEMYSNVFSISPEVVVSEQGFTRLNDWLRKNGMQVEEIPYHEVGKQEGLLRCSTLPLRRHYA